MIRYDNRDVGLSTKFHGQAVDLNAINAKMEAGDIAGAQALAPYSLTDMADDGLGLLTALGIKRAHGDDGTHAAGPRWLHRVGQKALLWSSKKIRQPGSAARGGRRNLGSRLLPRRRRTPARRRPLRPN